MYAGLGAWHWAQVGVPEVFPGWAGPLPVGVKAGPEPYVAGRCDPGVAELRGVEKLAGALPVGVLRTGELPTDVSLRVTLFCCAGAGFWTLAQYDSSFRRFLNIRTAA